MVEQMIALTHLLITYSFEHGIIQSHLLLRLEEARFHLLQV